MDRMLALPGIEIQIDLRFLRGLPPPIVVGVIGAEFYCILVFLSGKSVLTLTFPPGRLDSGLRGGVSGQASLATSQNKFFFLELEVEMAEGTIKRLTDKGFGFIDTGTNQDMFFHLSNLDGVTFEELQEGQRVTYTEGHGPKGPRAENVKPA